MPAKQKKHPALHRELLVQMQVNRSNAAAGGSGANVLASALMSVMVTLDGVPVTDLGPIVGNGTAAITLPTGWTVSGGFNVRPGGCDSSVTQFNPAGLGIYDIRIVPFLNNAACAWLSGEYIYAVQIKVSRMMGGKTVHLQGGAMGKLTIP